jgi:hypothetical protein
VRLGNFTLRADPDQLTRLHLAAVPPKAVELSHDSPGVTAGTITLTRSNGEDRTGQADLPPAGLASHAAPAAVHPEFDAPVSSGVTRSTPSEPASKP